MSNNSQQSFDQAYAVVHNEVYAPVFFEKLASDYNIVPQTAEDVTEMLTIARTLRENYEQEKAASATGVSPLLKVASALLQTPAHESDDVIIKQAAQNVAASPQFENALNVLLSTGE